MPDRRKSHCRHGHELSGDNVYIRPDNGQRQCRPCMASATRRYQAKKGGHPRPRRCECGSRLKKRHRVCGRCRVNGRNNYSISDVDRAWVYKRDGHACLRCGARESLTIDHVLPRALGGVDHRSNYQTLCVSCNAAKGATYADHRPDANGQMALALTPARATLKQRFMDKIVKQDDGCWMWTGATLSTGTPAMRVDGRTVTAPSVAARLFWPEPPTSRVYRTCGQQCVNPDHLTVTPTPALSARCRNGHVYTAENTTTDTDGTRRCRTCRRKSQTAWYRQKKPQTPDTAAA